MSEFTPERIAELRQERQGWWRAFNVLLEALTEIERLKALRIAEIAESVAEQRKLQAEIERQDAIASAAVVGKAAAERAVARVCQERDALRQRVADLEEAVRGERRPPNIGPCTRC